MTPQQVAELIAGMLPGRPPVLGSTRLVCIDGPAGSGKTTLGAELERTASRLGSVRLLHMDDLYEGWEGLAGDLTARIDGQLLGPLRSGRPGGYRRYDWERGRFAEWHAVAPVDTLVLEGVGSGAAAYDEAIALLVWVEVPARLREQRGLVRDGDAMQPNWRRWMEQEQEVFVRERTRERADVLVDGTGARAAVVVSG